MCPECGGKPVESHGFLVCSKCGLVLTQLIDYEPIRSNSHKKAATTVFEILFKCAEDLNLSLRRCLANYMTVRGTGAPCNVAVVVAVYVTARSEGKHVPLRRLCEHVTKYGMRVNHPSAVKALLKASRHLQRMTPINALRVIAQRLALDPQLVEQAEQLLSTARVLGGRDPQLLALAALYIASKGSFSYYALAKATGRSPSRIRENVYYLRKQLSPIGTWRSYT